MGDDRYPTNTDPQADYYGRPASGDYGRDYGSGSNYSYSSARSYQAAGELGGDRGRDDQYRGDRSRGDWGRGERSYGAGGQRDQSQGRDYYGGRGGYDRDRGQGGDQYRGSYASDGRRFEDVGRYRDADDDNRRGGQDRNRGYGRQPQGYSYEDRGFMQRAGDEVRSWFGDEDAERRRDHDARMDEQRYGQADRDHPHDRDYHSWRKGQIDALDRDYHEYRQENQQKFHNEFGAWRTARQGQRDSLSKVTEHQEVVGSDGEHVGTVDKVRDDRIILTKSDADAGGRHHSIPSRWIQTVDKQVKLSKTAQEAKDHWRDEERSGALFGNDQDRNQDRDDSRSGTNLNRSFSGTY